jgi:hypothetical protein
MAVTFARFNTYYYESLNFTWFILLWSTIALFAAILALRQPR